jgi:hypothetical protein
MSKGVFSHQLSHNSKIQLNIVFLLTLKSFLLFNHKMK